MAVDLLEDEDGPAAAAAPPRRPVHVRRWVAAALALVLVAGTVALLAADEVRADTRFDRSHSALGLTRRHTAVVRMQLAAVRGELHAVDGQVAQDRVALARDAAQLRQVQQTLSDARTHAALQAQDADALRTCLSGVEQALNALAVNDRTHALAALTAVAGGCRAAAQASG
jgi:hypothetical protein